VRCRLPLLAIVAHAMAPYKTWRARTDYWYPLNIVGQVSRIANPTYAL
jgi:hypothetical protein